MFVQIMKSKEDNKSGFLGGAVAGQTAVFVLKLVQFKTHTNSRLLQNVAWVSPPGSVVLDYSVLYD